MSRMIEHAERELRLAGLFDEGSDYDGEIAEAVMELVRVHAAREHSGGSHQAVVSLFAKVTSFKALSPLTSNPDEWNDITETQLVLGSQRKPCWQNKRQSSCFSEDGGKTWYDIDDKPRKIYRGRS